MASVTFTVVINSEEDGSFWAEVEELPGCFASGFSLEEVQEAVVEAMQLWLPDGVKLDDARWQPVGEARKRKSGALAAGQREMLVCA